MSYRNLRSFIKYLELKGELVRIYEEVDPVEEVTVIQHRVFERSGPALLFENVKNSPYRLVTNLFGTHKRVERVFGRHPGEIGENIISLADVFMPLNIKKVWKEKENIFRVAKVRLKTVTKGPVLDNIVQPPKLTQLPCLTCWPKDGGPFFTLPLVHTVDPETKIGNLGIYRLQRYDDSTTGMHWQIERGGGFHFNKACSLNIPLPVSVILGGPPALTIAAIASLPEGIDERLLACFIMGKPLEVIRRKGTGHKIPIQSEFVLEGKVCPGIVRREGPFGDHLGHYSHSADFPVFQVNRMLFRNNPVFPATVVGKPPQEDYYIGMAIQELSIPILKFMNPGISDFWAYPETGFHPLAVASVKERYPKEALKQAFAILGFSQLSLTKVLIITNGSCPDIRNFREVSRQVWKNLDSEEGLHLLAPTAQDTLDFTGPAMNTGSRLILLATERNGEPKRTKPPSVISEDLKPHEDILKMKQLGEAFLIVQVNDIGSIGSIRGALNSHPVTRQYLFHVLVSSDVPLDNPVLILWGWFTRFDPLVDIHPSKREMSGNKILFSFPVTIDARWKKGYREPVAFDPDTLKKVEKKWRRIESQIHHPG